MGGDVSTRALLLYSPAGSGHRAAAHAVAHALRTLAPDAAIEVRDVLEFAPRWFRYDRAWAELQQRGGAAWAWFFDASDRRGAFGLDRLRLPLHRALFAALDRHLASARPTHVVATHYLPALAVARQRRAGLPARALTVVTDHRVHQAWITPGVDGYCVADLASARALARREPGAPIAVTGIPIAPTAARPVVAVAGHVARVRVLALLGGVPTAAATAAIAALAPLARAARAQLRVLTGDAPCVRAAAIAALTGTDATVAARVDGLDAALDAVDVVVTKAGGLVVSECLARGRAMVLPFAAPGQERGNLEHALAVGAAVRPREVADTGAVIGELADEPGRLRRMSTLARMASRPDAALVVARRLLAGDAAHAEVPRAA